MGSCLSVLELLDKLGVTWWMLASPPTLPKVNVKILLLLVHLVMEHERDRDVHSLFGHMVCCISLLMVSAACYLSKLSAVLSTHIMLPGGALMGSLHATDLFKMKRR